MSVAIFFKEFFMSKSLAALLALAVLAWTVAFAPDWSGQARHGAKTATAPAKPAQEPVQLAALDTELDIGAWMDRAQRELGTQWSTWNQVDVLPLDASYEPATYSGRRYGGGASADALQAANVPGAAQFVNFGRLGAASMGGYASSFRGGSAGYGSKHPSTTDNSLNGTDNSNPAKTSPTENTSPDTSTPAATHPTTTENRPEAPAVPGTDTPTTTVPEPGTIGLLGLGLLGLALSLSRRRSQTA